MNTIIFKPGVRFQQICLSIIFMCSTVIVSGAPINNKFVNAIDITGLINGCSSPAQYTNISATFDHAKMHGGNASGYNVWFSFTAPASGQIQVAVKRGGDWGTIRRLNIALWEESGKTQINKARYVYENDTVSLGASSLQPGKKYYFSVDNNHHSRRGTFGLCVWDKVSNDYRKGATDISHLIDGCSENKEFSTKGATFDFKKGHGSNAHGYNRWFKFKCPASGQAKISVLTGGTEGDIGRINATLWSADWNEIKSKRYTSEKADVHIHANQIEAGKWYYLSVDNNHYTRRGSFKICLSSDVGYDYYEGAKDVTSLINHCSSDAEFTTLGATFDQKKGSCSNASGYNRWFKFKAPSTGEINVHVLRGGKKGSLRRANLTIWTSNLTELMCTRYVRENENVATSAFNLTPGDWYYFSVDNNHSSRRGTFTLCLNDKVDYDFYEGAKDITSIMDACSQDAAYTTLGASRDKNKGKNSNASGYNRWFKFDAPNPGNVQVRIERGGKKGNIRRINAAVWKADGITEVASKKYYRENDNIEFNLPGLEPNAKYYISVDNNHYTRRGTFSVCLKSTLDYDYFEGAKDVTALINGCSKNGEFSTKGATFDKKKGSCSNASGYNRWFKFTAPPSGKINVKTLRGGSKGSIGRVSIVIWDKDLNELACKRYTSEWENVSVNAVDLTPGEEYYITVDNNHANRRGTFTLCLSESLDYNYFNGALDVTAMINGCSLDAQFTTKGASIDGPKASCGHPGGYNRWFKFKAPVSGRINIDVNRGGKLGNIGRIVLGLFDENKNQIQCRRFTNEWENLQLSEKDLIPGKYYYFSVDNNHANRRGTFSLCLQDKMDYDYFDGAIVIANPEQWCSGNAEFTTKGATKDMNKAKCNNTHSYNRWFKFKSISSKVTVTVDRGGNKGNIGRVNLALWNATGDSVIACNKYKKEWDDVSLSSTYLVPGRWYYISVDNHHYNRRGSFTLCVDNIDQKFYAIKSGDWDNPSNWSILGPNGAPGSDIPNKQDHACISGHKIKVNGNEQVSILTLHGGNQKTSLIQKGTLNVNSKLEIVTDKNSFPTNIYLFAKAQLTTPKIEIRNSGFRHHVLMELVDNARVDCNGPFTTDLRDGSLEEVKISLNNKSVLNIQGDLELDNFSNEYQTISLKNDAELNISGNLNCNSVHQSMNQFSLNDDSKVSLKGNLINTDSKTRFVFSSNSQLSLTSNTNQLIQGSTSTPFILEKLYIDQTSTSNIVTVGQLRITKHLGFNNGILHTSEHNELIVDKQANVIGASDNSHVQGPIIKTGNEPFTFPVGDGTHLRRARISAPSSADAQYKVEFKKQKPSHSDKLDSTLIRITNNEYWEIDRINGTKGTDDIYLSLYWKDANHSQINHLDSLTIGHWNGTMWENIEKGETNGSLLTSGWVKSKSKLGNFSPYTFAKTVHASAPLPVDYAYVEAEINDDDDVEVIWATLNETNNDYFAIERSADAATWEDITHINGEGHSSKLIQYNYIDTDPLPNTSYYRIKQVDYNGDFSYSHIVTVTANNIDIHEVNAFPNPIRHGDELVVTLINYGFHEGVVLEVFDLVGSPVIKEKFDVHDEFYHVHKVDIPENMKPGLHVITVTSNNKKSKFHITVY